MIGHDNVPDKGLEEAEEEIESQLARQEVQQHQHILDNPVDCHLEIAAKEVEEEEEEEEEEEGNEREQQQNSSSITSTMLLRSGISRPS